MGFRNPFRLQVDENNVAYVTDYSPDSQTPQRSRGPSGVGRMEIVRHPANYGYPQCYSSKLGYYRWNFREFVPGSNPRSGAAWTTTSSPRFALRGSASSSSRTTCCQRLRWSRTLRSLCITAAASTAICGNGASSVTCVIISPSFNACSFQGVSPGSR